MKLIFATSNQNKKKEVEAILSSTSDIKVLGFSDIGFKEEIKETENSIKGNAILKANHIWDLYGECVFAEDTGLEVDALDGAPGVYSARYAGEGKNSDANIELLLQNMMYKNDRSAQFTTVIAYRDKNTIKSFTGIIKGQIAEKKMGNNGFGYDPIFIPDGYELSFAQMNQKEKNNISHRKLAMDKFIKFLYNKNI